MSTSPSFDDIKHAYARIKSDVKRTPIVESSLLNEWMGNRILFKAECLQTIGAFKLRGAMNFLARLKEEGRLPKHEDLKVKVHFFKSNMTNKSNMPDFSQNVPRVLKSF